MLTELLDTCETTIARYYAEGFLAELERCFEEEECSGIAACVDDVSDDFDAFEGAAQAFADLFTPTTSSEPASNTADAGAGGSASMPEGDAGGIAGSSSEPAPSCAPQIWNSTKIDSFENPAPEIGGARYSFFFDEESQPVAPSLLDGSYALHSTAADHTGDGGGLILDFGHCIDASSFAGLEIWAMSSAAGGGNRHVLDQPRGVRRRMHGRVLVSLPSSCASRAGWIVQRRVVRSQRRVCSAGSKRDHRPALLCAQARGRDFVRLGLLDRRNPVLLTAQAPTVLRASCTSPSTRWRSSLRRASLGASKRSTITGPVLEARASAQAPSG
jgi:hypothetical protein